MKPRIKSAIGTLVFAGIVALLSIQGSGKPGQSSVSGAAGSDRSGGGGEALRRGDILHGLPVSDENINVLVNRAFSVGYSERRRNPLWVAYQVKPIGRHQPMERPSRFEIDRRTSSAVTHRALSGSGYERGHLAPNFVIAQLYGSEAQRETFLMTNIAPQKTNLNRYVWQRLEEIETRYFAKWFDEVWVITGPVFAGKPRRLPSGVQVPDHFYRIFVDVSPSGETRALAFIVPQDVIGNEPLDQFVVTIDEVERRTGLDFFAELADAKEDQLESAMPDSDWQLPKIRNFEGRYWKDRNTR